MKQEHFSNDWGVQFNEASMRFSVLYKRDSSGKIREWKMEVEGSFYRSVACLEGGKENISQWREAFAKNTGKVNETTGHTQAIAECEAKYAKKLKTGFVRSVEDVDAVTYIKAMKAANYDSRRTKIPFSEGVYVQPKLNGIRCIATKDNLFTYGGEIIKSCNHIRKALEPVFHILPDLVFDGELYNHDYKDDLPTLSGLVRLQDPDMFQIANIESILQYHVFDEMSEPEQKFIFRHSLVSDLCSPMSPVVDINYIKEVHTQIIHSREEADSYFDLWTSQGYEGQMIRIEGPYQMGKRSNLLVKRKEFKDAEFPVEAVEEGQGNWAGCAKRITVRLPGGLTCGAGVRGTLKQTQFILQQSKKGILPEEVTVRFLKYTPDGKLDSPTVTNIHWKKRRD